jgi:hypothetical protein
MSSRIVETGRKSVGSRFASADPPALKSIAELGDRINGDATLRSWEESLKASRLHDAEVWLHGDLLPGNLIVVDGRLSAIIDFGCLNGRSRLRTAACQERVRRRQSHSISSRASGRRCVILAWPWLGARPAPDGAPVLLGHQRQHDRQASHALAPVLANP